MILMMFSTNLASSMSNQLMMRNHLVGIINFHVSNEKSGYPSCLGYKGDEILSSYIGIIS